MAAVGPIAVRDGMGEIVRTLDFTAPVHAAQPLIQSATDELRGCGTCPSRADNALRTSAVLDAALRSYYGGRDDEFWMRPETWPGSPKRRRSSV